MLCPKLFWIVFIHSFAIQQMVYGFSIKTTRQKVFKTGENMTLSCFSKVSTNLTWWFSGEPLYNSTIRTSDGTTILQISNISIKNQGIYWCGSSWQHIINITVLIGDFPSPPRNVNTMSVEFNMNLQWTSSESTGGLPVHYIVTFYSKGTYVPALVGICGSQKHETGKRYSCNLAKADLFKRYRAIVYAINALGNSSDSIYFQRPNVIYPVTNPLPPLHLAATEIQQGKVKLSWKYREDTGPYIDITYFRIAYKKERDERKKTWLPDNKGEDTTVIIDNLDADTTYWFYVMKQYRIPNISSPLSAPAEVRLHTKYAAPDQPPQNLKCYELKSNSSNSYTIKVSWKPPSKGHTNGPLTVYKVTYKKQSGNHSVVNVDASQTHTSFTVANLDETVVVYANACNKGGFCSGISDSCQIQGLNRPTKIKTTGSDHTVLIIIISIVGCIFALVVIVVVLKCIRRKYENNPGNNLPEVLDDPYNNYDPVNEPEDETYDSPLVLNEDCAPRDTAI